MFTAHWSYFWFVVFRSASTLAMRSVSWPFFDSRDAPFFSRAATFASSDAAAASITEFLFSSDAVFASEDAQEGPRAFAEKRPPNFQGK